ncbi:hypothetical protein EJ03DRAFT_382967, partial [Teratosphaeria nubilosa]
MSRQQIVQHYSRLLRRWPVDRLRPEDRQFRSLLRKRLQTPPTPYRNEAAEVNAAYSLLDDTYAKQYPLGEKMMRPASNPNHYLDLGAELDEAPDRTWLQGFVKRMKEMIRF